MTTRRLSDDMKASLVAVHRNPRTPVPIKTARALERRGLLRWDDTTWKWVLSTYGQSQAQALIDSDQQA